jgi:hypothetical protein
MKTKITFLLVALMFIFSGCSGFKNKISKMGDGLSSGDYKVTVWSGGKAVAVYEIENSFVNSENTSDGWFFYVDGKLVRISGTITVEEK